MREIEGDWCDKKLVSSGCWNEVTSLLSPLTIRRNLVASGHPLVGLFHQNRWIIGSFGKFCRDLERLVARSHLVLVALDFAASSAPSSPESYSTSLDIWRSMEGSLNSSNISSSSLAASSSNLLPSLSQYGWFIGLPVESTRYVLAPISVLVIFCSCGC